MTRRRSWGLAGLLIAATLTMAALNVRAADSPVPIEARRAEEQSLLTFPEWYLVHSPAEYARIVETRPAHAFPFIEQTAQLWAGYREVTGEQIRGHYPLNPGYHLMILVIATSTTVEYALRSLYENTVGRASWLLGGNQLTDEDTYAAKAAQAYVDFIRQRPWYEFDFMARLKGLWTEVPLTGPGLVRKWERRYALTTEYACKALYGKLIEHATDAAYEDESMVTEVVVERLPRHWVAPPQVNVLERLPDGRARLSLPRYYNFRIAATALAEQGIPLTDIAGNTEGILVTVWAKTETPIPEGHWRVLFEQALTQPAHTRRIALWMPVSELTPFLKNAPGMGLMTEHVYDY